MSIPNIVNPNITFLMFLTVFCLSQSKKSCIAAEAPVNIYGRVINGTGQGAENATYGIYLNDTLWWSNITDTEGYYNVTLNTSTSTGIFNLWINATYPNSDPYGLDQYSEKNMSFSIFDIPNINEHTTSQPSLYYLGHTPLNFTITANVTDANLVSVNFTLIAPNGTLVLNKTNSTTYYEDWFNSTNISLDQYGLWEYTITAWDSDGFNDTVVGYIKVLNLSMQMNTSIAEVSDTINVQGHLSDLDGSDLANTSLCIHINYSSDSQLYNCSVSWWHNGWPYRKEIVVDNLVSTGFNYTIALVNLTTSSLISEGKVNSDCGNIRFSDTQGTELLYTIETSTCDSDNTLFWVWGNWTEDQNTTAWAYYGNDDAYLKRDYINPDDSLWLLMHFDRSTEYGESATKFFDFSQKGNNGTCISGYCPFATTGVFGNSVSFNGDDNFINISDTGKEYNFSLNQFTILAWINRTSDSGNIEYIVDKRDSSTDGFALYIGSDDGLKFRTDSTISEDVGTIDTGVMYFVAATADGSDQRLYVNGELVDTDSQTTSLEINTSLIIGARSFGGHTFYWNGTIDELRIYNRSLSQDEILAAFNSTKSYVLGNETLIKTDSQGNYNYDFTAPSTQGVHAIVINSSSSRGYAQQYQELTIMNFPAINSYSTNPDKIFYTQQYGTVFNLSSDVTDLDSNLISVNYTLTAPNGTHIYYNINATEKNGDVWTSEVKKIDQYGQWNYTITAWDSMNGSRTIHDSIKFLQITNAMNDSIIAGNDSIRLSGYVYDEHGEPVVNNSIFFFINGIQLNLTDGWNFDSQNHWWNISWRHRTNLKVRINNSIDIDNALVMVNFSTTEFISDSKMKPNCTDIRFADVNGNELNFQIEPSTCNLQNTIAWVWYNMTQYTNHTIYAYYDNEYATTKTDYENPDNSLKLLMHFDNFTGYGESDSNIFDFSLNKNNGTPSGVELISDCKFGSCYEFDEHGDQIFVKDSDSLTFGNGDIDYPFTITAWINMSDATNFTIVSKRLGEQYAEYALYTNHSDYMYFSLYDNYNNISSFIYTNETLTTYEKDWIFVVATYNGTGGHNGTKIYVNAILQNFSKGNQSGEYDYTAMHNEDCPLYIGTNQSETSSRGKIDELRIYNKSMTQKEISALYNLTETYIVSNYSFTRTDSEGYYNYTFVAPAELGIYEMKINSTYNSVFGMKNNTLLVTTDANAPPEIQSLSFNTQMPVSSTNLECWATVTDAENEILTVEYWWYNQTSGSELYSSGNNTNIENNTYSLVSAIPHLNTTVDEKWNCTIRVYDSEKYSENSSVSVSVVNFAPNLTNLQMSPEQPNTTSTIKCYANLTDDSNSTPVAEWFWYNLTDTGYQKIFSGNTTMDNSTYGLVTELGSENTTTGETWNCTIRTFDGLNKSGYQSQVSIINTPPTLKYFFLPQQANDTSIFNYYVNATDPESSNLDLYHSWYNLTPEGYELKFVGSTSITNNTLETLNSFSPDYTTPGETWNLTIYVSDGSNSTSLSSLTINISAFPNITYNSLGTNDGFDLLCNVKATDDLNDTFNVEYYWYNQTSGSDLMFRDNISITNNTLTTVNTLAESQIYDGEYWNCTVRVYDGTGYSNFSSNKRLVDKNPPDVTINYPNASQIVSQHKLEVNYTLNESNLNYTWYTHDYNDTKVQLEYDTNDGVNLENITFAYPGKHILKLYVNDTFGNTVSDTVTFYVNDYLNTTEWSFYYNDSQTNITSVSILDTQGILIDDNITLDQNVTIEINMTNTSMYIYNISTLETAWEFFFDITDNSTEVVSSIDTNYGKQAVDYVYVTNFTLFNSNSSNYYGKVVLPSNSYDDIYYCEQDLLDDCASISQCTYNYTKLNTTACYLDIGNRYNVYVPHFSAIIGVNDSVAPTITFLNPVNGSELTESYKQNISFIVNEESTCRYSFNLPTYTLLGTGTSFIINLNYTENKFRNITVKCEDLYSNIRISTIYYTLSDTSYPDLSSFSSDEDLDEISFTFDTDEPANTSILLVGKELQENYLYNLDHSYTFSNLTSDTDYTFNITLCDRIGNCHTYQEEATTDEVYSGGTGGSSGGSSSSGGDTTTNSVVNHVFFSLSEGEHYINIASSEIAITRIIFTMNKVVNGSILFTIQKKDLPAVYPGLENTYQYVSIDKTRLTDDDISSAKIKFRVEKEWVQDNNIDIDTISLYRYANRWIKLNTLKTSSDSTYTYYESTSPGFSYFAIKGEEKQQQILDDTDEDIGDSDDTITGNIIDDVEVVDNLDNVTQPEKDTGFNVMLVIIPVIVLIIVIMGVGTVITISQKGISRSQDSSKSTYGQSQQPGLQGSIDYTQPAMQQPMQPSPEEITEIKQYILLCRSEGVEDPSIRSVLLQAGWNQQVIEKMMNETGMPEDEISMIITYIQTLRQNNIPDEQIKQKLRQVGWQEFAITEAFKRI